MKPVRKLSAIGLAAAALVLSGAAFGSVRTLYEIRVSAAGTKSQGLRGVLYDRAGRPVEEGPVEATPIGSFRWVPCRMLWDSCGRWRVGPVAPRSAYTRENGAVLGYTISYEQRGGRTWWRGTLDGLGAGRPGRRVETPMGAFRWTSGRAGRADWQGWVPEGWPDLPIAPGGN